MSEVEDFLEHYGIKGQKWGVRRGKSTTGVSRFKGSRLDQKQRSSAKFDRRIRQKGTLLDRVSSFAAHKALGEQRAKKYYNFRMDYVKGQQARMKAGKTNVVDKLETAGRLYINPAGSVAGLAIRGTHGNKGRLADKYG